MVIAHRSIELAMAQSQIILVMKQICLKLQTLQCLRWL